MKLAVAELFASHFSRNCKKAAILALTMAEP